MTDTTDFPELPESMYWTASRKEPYRYTAENMRAYVLSDRASRAAPRAAEPVAWRMRFGDSDMWGFCETEVDANFLGKQSGVRYVKEPLYAAPQAPAAQPLTEGEGNRASRAPALEALRVIAEFPITHGGNIDAYNMREIALASLAARQAPKEPTA